MNYYTSEYKSILRNTHRLICVSVTGDAIKPLAQCQCGQCLSDGSICGYFEGLAADMASDGGWQAKCSARRW